MMLLTDNRKDVLTSVQLPNRLYQSPKSIMSVDKVKLPKKSDFYIIIQNKFINQREDT